MKYIVEIELSEADGVAQADVALHHPVHGAHYSSATVNSHGSHHTVTRGSDEIQKDYIDAWRAFQAAVRHVTAGVERDWNEHARTRGTGVR